MKDKNVESLLAGFRKPEIIVEHVWEAWSKMETKIGGPMDPKIKPIWRGAKAVGTAVTVEIAPGVLGESWMRAQEVAGPGDVIVIDEKGSELYAAWGGMISGNAKRRGVAGVVIDGATRNLEEIDEIKFPVFAKGLSPIIVTYPTGMVDRLNVPISCGGVIVRPGDIIVATDGGVVSIPIENAAEVLKYSELLVKFDAKEAKWFQAGKTHRQMRQELGGDHKKKFEWGLNP